jgi:3-oxoacyl-[acyl-carrier-protein] synthase-3
VADGWIFKRTGIRERRWAAPENAVSEFAVRAADMALRQAGVPRARIGLTLLATSTPDHLLPPTAPLLAHRLGLTGSGAVDLTGACAGFLYAFVLAEAFVRATRNAALVVAANILSRRIDMDDRTTAALFADGAGAVVLAPSDRPDAGLIASSLSSDGEAYGLIQVPAGDHRLPFGLHTCACQTRIQIRDGRGVFVRAVAMMVASCRAVLDKAALPSASITHFVPHQANVRIIEAVANRLSLTPAQVLSTVAEFGNSSAATIPLSLSWSSARRAYRRGDTMLLAAAGAGMTGGAAIYRW